MQKEVLIFKASGKILIAGGYGVLQEGNLGISLAVNRHFYSIVRDYSRQCKSQEVHIKVQSAQIRSQWSYKFNKLQQSIAQQHQLQNPFLQNAIKYALKYTVQKEVQLIDYLTITILFDRGFLSENSEQTPKDQKFITYQENVSKTGLGSSACVLVVVVKAILTILLPQITQVEINCVSQVANIAAQNKIGSNFDISTAIFGSQLYKNKLPKKAFEALENNKIQSLLQINPQIQKVNPVSQIKKHSYCLLIDLKKGSNTRTMVNTFVKTLNSLNSSLILQFYLKNKKFVSQIFNVFSSKLDRIEIIDRLRELNCSYRQFLQDYSKYTNVPIQPPEFKQFIDSLIRLNGVMYSICPGSGGYDAIFILGLAQDNNEKQTLKKDVQILCNKYWNLCQIYQITIEWEQLNISEEELKQIKTYLSVVL